MKTFQELRIKTVESPEKTVEEIATFLPDSWRRDEDSEADLTTLIGDKNYCFEFKSLQTAGETVSPALSRLRVTVNLRFPGQYYDRETGFFYNRARYYDPGTGRFVSSDPMGLAGGINTYSYVANNPLRWIDPLGLWGAGISVSVSTINPFTSGGGGVYGVNAEYTSSGGWGVYTFGTPNNDPSNGFQPGISVTLNGAQGTGDWSGAFDSTTGSYGLATGGFFESSPGGSTPGYFGWEGGISFGSPVGIGSATTNYTQIWPSNSCSN